MATGAIPKNLAADVSALNSNKAPQYIKLSGGGAATGVMQDTIALLISSRDGSCQVDVVNFWRASSLSVILIGSARFTVSKQANSYNYTITNLLDGNTTILLIG